MDRVSRTFKVVPGVPGMPHLKDGERVPYPDSTIDFVKVARTHGLEAEFPDSPEERSFAGHKAADVWLPILQWSSGLLTGVGAGLLVELLKDYLGMNDEEAGDPPGHVLHIDWTVVQADGSAERFVADGPTADVLEALGEFERRHSGGQGEGPPAAGLEGSDGGDPAAGS